RTKPPYLDQLDWYRPGDAGRQWFGLSDDADFQFWFECEGLVFGDFFKVKERMMKKSSISIFKVLVLAGGITCFNSCSDFLERQPDTIMTDDQIFGDAVMIRSVLANYYGRVNWGQHNGDSYTYTILDEAGRADGGPDNIQNYANDLWRVYDYTLIRNINQFLQGLRETTALAEDDKRVYEGEARFLRAWTYFNMARGMGGMPIVGDEVFEYESGTDIT